MLSTLYKLSPLLPMTALYIGYYYTYFTGKEAQITPETWQPSKMDPFTSDNIFSMPYVLKILS